MDKESGAVVVLDREKKWEHLWEEMFALYQEFKQIYGREPKQRELYKGTQLGRWCCTQKTYFREKKLNPEREGLLREAGFPFFDCREMYWQDMFLLYQQFRKEKGREPKYNEEYYGEMVGRWSYGQKKAFLEGRLSEEREQLFRGIGVIANDEWIEQPVSLEGLISMAKEKVGSNVSEKEKWQEVGGR